MWSVQEPLRTRRMRSMALWRHTTLLHDAVDPFGGGKLRDKCCCVTLDAGSAFLYADVLSEISIALPAEDQDVGRLDEAIYGTRATPMACQEKLATNLQKWSFALGQLLMWQ